MPPRGTTTIGDAMQARLVTTHLPQSLFAIVPQHGLITVFAPFGASQPVSLMGIDRDTAGQYNVLND